MSVSSHPTSPQPTPHHDDHHPHHSSNKSSPSSKTPSIPAPFESSDKIDANAKTKSRLLWFRLSPKKALALATIALSILFFRPTTQSAASAISALTAYASQLGTTRATLLLFCTNFFTVLFCFPANMGLMIAAGAILPPLNAFTALFFSKLAAACVAFVLSRTLLMDRARNAISRRYPRLASLLEGEGATTGWRFVLLMRLSPFPGFILNYLLSLTGVSFLHYFFGSVIGIAPPIINLILIGNAAKEVGVGVAGGAVGAATKAAWLPLGLKVATVASMVSVTVYITRFISKSFDKNGTIAAAAAVENDDTNGTDSYICNGTGESVPFEGSQVVGKDEPSVSIDVMSADCTSVGTCTDVSNAHVVHECHRQ